MLTTTDVLDTSPVPSAPLAPQPPTSCCSDLKNKKLLLGVLAGAIILALIGTVAFGAYQLGRSQTTNPSPIVATPSTTPVVEPAPDPTTNWQIYTNTKYNYEIKYPSDWTAGVISSLGNIATTSSVNFREKSDQTPAESGYVISVISSEDSLISQTCLKSGSYAGGESAQGFLCGRNVQATTKVINGISWEVLQEDSVGNVPSGSIAYNTVRNHKLYFIISFSNPDKTFFYDQILPTFKFF